MNTEIKRRGNHLETLLSREEDIDLVNLKKRKKLKREYGDLIEIME